MLSLVKFYAILFAFIGLIAGLFIAILSVIGASLPKGSESFGRVSDF